MIHQIWVQFVADFQQTSGWEWIAVVSGIASVWYSRQENILVYPVGLLSTIIYTFISFHYHLLGEASVNLYYTIMSIYGWILWAKRNEQHEHLVQIRFSTKKEWGTHILFCLFFYIVLFGALTWLKKGFATGAIPWADAFASATAFTGMWLMAKKKVESWYWWLATNLASIPLYFVKHLVLTSFYYLVLLILAVFGLLEWQRKARSAAKIKFRQYDQ